MLATCILFSQRYNYIAIEVELLTFCSRPLALSSNMSATGFTPQELMIIIKIIIILKLINTKLYNQKDWLSKNLAILLQIGLFQNIG